MVLWLIVGALVGSGLTLTILTLTGLKDLAEMMEDDEN